MDQATGHRIKGKSRKKWDALPPFGQEICHLFLPMKTPYNSPLLSIPGSNFRGSHLNQFLRQNPQYCAVINLCMVEFYDRSCFNNLEVEYHHFPSYSYDELIPERQSRDEFKKLVTEIRGRNPNKKIIVHCTHGCNRTGYMVATYLSEEMDMDVFEALRLFTEKRPPGPYHLEGIEGFLQETYGKTLPSQQFEYMKDVAQRIKNTVFQN